MTERERTDFLRGDTNNEHFYKRGRNTTDSEQAQKKFRVDDTQDIGKKSGSVNVGKRSFLRLILQHKQEMGRFPRKVF